MGSRLTWMGRAACRPTRLTRASHTCSASVISSDPKISGSSRALKVVRNAPCYAHRARASVPVARIAALSDVQTILRERAPKTPAQNLVNMIRPLAIMSDSPAPELTRPKALYHAAEAKKQEADYPKLPAWCLENVRLNPQSCFVLGLSHGNTLVTRKYYSENGVPCETRVPPHQDFKDPSAPATFAFLYVAPEWTNRIFPVAQQVLSLDGTRHRYVGQILMGSVRVAGSHLALSALFCKTESEQTHRWYLESLTWHNPNVRSLSVAIVSDRDKGLENAVSALLPGQGHIRDPVHLIRNVHDNCRGYKIVDTLLWAVIAARTFDKQHSALEALKAHYQPPKPAVSQNITAAGTSASSSASSAMVVSRAPPTPTSVTPAAYLASVDDGHRKRWAFASYADHDPDNGHIGTSMWGLRSSGAAEPMNNECRLHKVRDQHALESCNSFLSMGSKKVASIKEKLSNCGDPIMPC